MTTNTLQQVAAEGLQQAIELLKAAGSEAAQQIPDVARQYVHFKIADACIDTALATFVIVLARAIWKRAEKHERESWMDDTKPVLCVVSCVLFAFGVFGAAVSVTQLAKAAIAPKVLILEKADQLVRGK